MSFVDSTDLRRVRPWLCEAKVEGMWGGAAVEPAMGSTAAEVKMGDGEACEANGSVW